MKKYFIMAPLLALAATGAFALDLTAGLVLNTSNGNWYYDYKITNFGFFGSLGWKYFDINTALIFNTTTWDMPEKNTTTWNGPDKTEDETSTGALVGLSFKFPFTISPSFRLYPIVGFDFAFYNPERDISIELYLDGGLGADIILLENMFLRAVIMGGFNVETEGGGVFVIRVGVGWML